MALPGQLQGAWGVPLPASAVPPELRTEGVAEFWGVVTERRINFF